VNVDIGSMTLQTSFDADPNVSSLGVSILSCRFIAHFDGGVFKVFSIYLIKQQ